MLYWAHHSFGLGEWDSEPIYLPPSESKRSSLFRLFFLLIIKERLKRGFKNIFGYNIFRFFFCQKLSLKMGKVKMSI